MACLHCRSLVLLTMPGAPTVPLTRYENNEAANLESFFSNGFFCTGDMGFMDHEGYLFITGRSKEVSGAAATPPSPHTSTTGPAGPQAANAQSLHLLRTRSTAGPLRPWPKPSCVGSQVINRGGEIVSPFDVEEAVISHPRVKVVRPPRPYQQPGLMT